MAKKEALRELQARLAERLLAAKTEERQRSWLAVECAGQGLLMPLEQAGEIFAVMPIVAVPHTAHWFLGVANLRGGLYGVADLSRFLGLKPLAPEPGARDQARLIALNLKLQINAALRVDRLAGLRSASQLTLEPAQSGSRPGYAGAEYRDGAGRLWQELDLASLATDPAFVSVVA